MKQEHIIYGGDYNPDQWIRTKEIWSEDMRLMDLAGINSATVGIFSWSMLEPREGEFDFSWLDEVMDMLHVHGKKAILATPSGARPVWLAKKAPEVLRVDESGVRNEYGVRHNHCLTSPVYREKVRLINRKLAERYAKHPALFMWHISNEYSGECHCELCQQAFRDWLRREYHNDIDELNFKWWNGFWSHNLSSFDEVSSPKYRGENHVPALKLAWNRFVSDSHISFLENEIAPLREITPDVPVTTNMMRLFKGIDYRKMAEKLDLVSWDSYPSWNNTDNTEEGNAIAFVHDLFRSMKGGKPFFLMESTPSIVNWKPVNPLPQSGITELSSIQAVAHGADSVQYFQWRASRGGHEKFHGAVVDHTGTEHTRVFRDAAKIGQVLPKLDAVVGKETRGRVAIVNDCENAWATDIFCGFFSENRDYDGVCTAWHKPFWKRGVPTDVIESDADLAPYDLVIAPFLYMLKPGVADSIRRYVGGGGRFVATELFARVDRDDLCFLGGFPGEGLREVFGVTAEETDALPETERRAVRYNGRDYAAHTVCDLLRADGAKVLGTYENGFYAGTPAVTVNGFGKGRAYYAAFRGEESFIDDFCADLIEEIGLTGVWPDQLPDGVSAVERGDLVFLMNFTSEPKRVPSSGTYRNVLTGDTVSGKTELPPFGYVVLTR
ncbi:MAG: beta-galactosidase [Clostridia bacterium]|nr:beta-galactosidase [Clostridia bacterium]